MTPASGPSVNSGTVTFTVKKGTVTIGSAVTSTTVSAGSATASFSLAGINADTYVVEAVYNTGSGFGSSNNFGQSPAPTLTVSKASLVVTPDAKSRTYGQAAPTYTFGVTGFQNSETAATAAGYVAPTCTSDYTATTPVSASPRTISCSGGSANNYTFNTTATAQLTISSKSLTITASDTTKTYGDTVTFDGTTPSIDFSVVGLVNSDTVDSITLTSTGAAATATVAGSPYDIVPSAAVGTGLGNYDIAYQNGKLTVDARDLTITASDTTKTYGDTVTFDGTTPSIDFSVVGLVNSDTVDSITLTSTGAAATATVAGSPYDIVPSAAVGTGLGNYDIAYQNGKLTVDARDLTITASDTTKTYGDTVTFDGTTPSIDFSVVGLVNSDTVDSITLTSTGAAATATVAGSPYDIVPSAAVGTGLGNYDIAYQNGKLTVDARDLTITASDTTKTYGDTVTFDGTTPSIDFSVVGLVNSDTVDSITLTSTGAAATATVAGSPYDIVPSAAVGTGLGNYDIAYQNGKLTVDARDLTITASDTTKTYGDTVTFDGTTPSIDFSVVGLVNSDTVDSITLTSTGAAATATVAGSPYDIVPSAAVGTGLGNYDIAYQNGKLTVDARDLTITASDTTKTYGDTVTFDGTTPSIDFSVVGLVNSDTVDSITLTSTGAAATATVAGSPYDIVPSAAVGTGLGNYDIAYQNGKLTVDARDLTITASDTTKTYGDTVTFDGTTPSIDFSVVGLVNSDTVDSITLTSTGAAATATVAGSPYDIVPSAAVGTGLGNYDIAYQNGKLTVDARDLTITADAIPSTAAIDHFSRPFGYANPPFSVRYVGLVNGETPSVLGGTLGFITPATSASLMGSYSVTPGGLTSTNYDIHFVAGTLDITAGYRVVGFTSPVDMTTAGATPYWNSIKGGQTVPLKFKAYRIAYRRLARSRDHVDGPARCLCQDDVDMHGWDRRPGNASGYDRWHELPVLPTLSSSSTGPRRRRPASATRSYVKSEDGSTFMYTGTTGNVVKEAYFKSK